MTKDKRQEILAAAEALFADNGFEGTSVRDIAQAASVNIAMISYYFGSKEKLLDELVALRSSYTLGFLQEIGNDNTLAPWDKMEKLIDYYVDKILSHRRFHCIMTHLYSTTNSEKIEEMITEIRMKNIDQIKKIILEGQRKKVFRHIDMDMTISTITGTISQIATSQALFSKLMNIDKNDNEAFNKKLGAKLKKHLKDLLKAYLVINNE